MKHFLLLMATLTILGTGYGQDYNFLGEYSSDGIPKYFDGKEELAHGWKGSVTSGLWQLYSDIQPNKSAARLEVSGLHPGMYVYTIIDFQNGKT